MFTVREIREAAEVGARRLGRGNMAKVGRPYYVLQVRTNYYSRKMPAVELPGDLHDRCSVFPGRPSPRKNVDQNRNNERPY